MATTSGVYKASITVGSVAIAGNPFDVTVHPAPTALPSSTAIAASAVTGVVHSFLVTARDAFHNRQERPGDYFVAWVEGGAYIDALVTDNLNSTYTVTWTPPQSGIYLVHVLLSSGDAGCCGLTGNYYTNRCVVARAGGCRAARVCARGV